MPDQVSDTHGQLLTGTAGAALGLYSLGTFQVAQGGPWTIFGVWAQVVAATATAVDNISGFLQIDAPSGDIDPYPSPSSFPFPATNSFLGAVADQVVCPLRIWPVNWKVQGGGTVRLQINLDQAVTVAAQVVAGIIYGMNRPPTPLFTWVDRVTAEITVATEAAVGTIRLSEKAKKIVAVCGTITQNNSPTAGEEVLGFIRLDSPDVKLSPMQFPLSSAIGAGLGATIAQLGVSDPVWIPTLIPVIGGSSIQCFVDLNTALTNPATVDVWIAYE